jgi:hypothetical protein
MRHHTPDQSSVQGKKTAISCRYVRQEVIDALSPVERLFAQEYLRTGRWILIEKPGRETPARENHSKCIDGGSDE